MPKPPGQRVPRKKPSDMPVIVRFDEEALDLVFAKAEVDGPNRQEPILRLADKLRAISKTNRHREV
jgi:hypothetical protein